jgi:hypothetical protein
MKRMGSEQSKRRKYDTENCDVAGGPGQSQHAGDDDSRAKDDSNLKGRGRNLAIVVARQRSDPLVLGFYGALGSSVVPSRVSGSER